jgi:hypothetical protein
VIGVTSVCSGLMRFVAFPNQLALPNAIGAAWA